MRLGGYVMLFVLNNIYLPLTGLLGYLRYLPYLLKNQYDILKYFIKYFMKYFRPTKCKQILHRYTGVGATM